MKKALVGFVLVAAIAPITGASAAATHPLVYMSAQKSLAKLYVLTHGSSFALSAANSNGHDCGPAFRPGADDIAFESNRTTPGAYDANNFEIYTFNLRSKKVARLTYHPGWDAFPAWSPDGKKIAFSREDDPVNAVSTPLYGQGVTRTMSIWVMNADGSRLERLTRATPGQMHLFASWSPDGKQIAFSNGGIYVMNADGSNIRVLSWDGEYPTWSPDGKWIAFDSTRNDPMASLGIQGIPLNSDVFVMRSDGSQQRRLGHAGNSFWPNWSPDGTHIAFVHSEVGWVAPVLTVVLPTGNGVDAWLPNPPMTVWELTLGSPQHAVSRRQLTHGTTDLFPHYG